MNHQPIGIFDSGVGGLSVARSINAQLPDENMIYVADSANAPYGERTDQFIFERSCLIINYLLGRQVKVIIVACNTATVSVIARLRKLYSTPIIGVEPGIKPAVCTTKNGKIGVLVTQKTKNSASFVSLLERYNAQADIAVQACPGLVELIETGQLEGVAAKRMVKLYLQPLIDKGIDTVVMGCTHYAFLTKLVTEVTEGRLNIINTYQAIAAETSRQLHVNALKSSHQEGGCIEFYSSHIDGNTALLYERLWGAPVVVNKF